MLIRAKLNFFFKNSIWVSNPLKKILKNVPKKLLAKREVWKYALFPLLLMFEISMKIFGHISNFLQTLKPNAQKTAPKFNKHVK
jgi:hypothetical protein